MTSPESIHWTTVRTNKSILNHVTFHQGIIKTT